MLEEHRLDLTDLDAIAVDFDLAIDSAQVFEVAIDRHRTWSPVRYTRPFSESGYGRTVPRSARDD